MTEHAIPSTLEPIASDGLLLHVGVFKTGTTALQETLRRSPDLLADHGVLFRGPASWGFTSLVDHLQKQPTDGPWDQLVADVTAHQGRAMVSAENLCTTTPEDARYLVKALGRGRSDVRVMVTIRPVAALLTSTWQQLIKRGLKVPLDEWLRDVFDNPDHGFWRRNEFYQQVVKWGAVVGEGNVVLVMSDKRQPRTALSVVERCLAIPDGSVRERDVRSNSSMSFTEAEFLRRVNCEVKDSLSRVSYQAYVRLGVFPAVYGLADPTLDPVPLPAWAADAAADRAAAMIPRITASAATVVGDIMALTDKPKALEGPLPEISTVSMDMAVAAVVGAVTAKPQVKGRAAAPKPPRTLGFRIRRRLRRLRAR